MPVMAGHGDSTRSVLSTSKNSPRQQATMADFLSHFAVPIAIGAVAVVLVLGLLNMMRGGSPNRSQQLMRMRVLLQAIAIVVALLALLAVGR